MSENIVLLEKEFIGILFLKPSRIDETVLPEKCFVDKLNHYLYKFLKLQWHDHKSIDVASLVENYRYDIEIAVNINDFIVRSAETIDLAATDSNFEYIEETLYEAYKKRQVLLLLKKFEKNQVSYEQLLSSIQELETSSSFEKEKKLTGDEIFELVNKKKEYFEFQFKNFSHFANIQKHDFVIIAARPGIGKTAFALNLCYQLSKKYKTLFFSMEMAEKQIYSRLLSIASGIPIKYFDKPETSYQKERMKEEANLLAEQRLEILYSSQTVRSIKSKIVKKCKKEHVVVFIDYVGLIEPEGKQTTLYEQTTKITKTLRNISLDYDCTIFLVSQLSRNSNDAPKLSDLKNSGELEQAATTALLLNPTTDSTLDKVTIDVSIAKNRNGRVGIIPMKYDKNTQRFVE